MLTRSLWIGLLSAGCIAWTYLIVFVLSPKIEVIGTRFFLAYTAGGYIFFLMNAYWAARVYTNDPVRLRVFETYLEVTCGSRNRSIKLAEINKIETTREFLHVRTLLPAPEYSPTLSNLLTSVVVIAHTTQGKYVIWRASGCAKSVALLGRSLWQTFPKEKIVDKADVLENAGS
jgi:hypothetical protein